MSGRITIGNPPVRPVSNTGFARPGREGGFARGVTLRCRSVIFFVQTPALTLIDSARVASKVVKTLGE